MSVVECNEPYGSSVYRQLPPPLYSDTSANE